MTRTQLVAVDGAFVFAPLPPLFHPDGLRAARRARIPVAVDGAFVFAPLPPLFHPDGLRAARRARIPGCCLFCEDPLPPRSPGQTGRFLEVCGSSHARGGCARAWRAAYKRDRRFSARH